MKTDQGFTGREAQVEEAPVEQALQNGWANPHRKRTTSRTVRVTSYVIMSLLLFVFFVPLPVHFDCLHHKFVPTRLRSFEDRAKHILRHNPLIDGHNDLAIWIRANHGNHINNESFSKPFAEGGLDGHVDIPRLQNGLNGGAFWSVFWPCPANGTDYSDENYHSAIQGTFQQIDVLARLQAAHPSVFSPPTLTSREALHRFRWHHQFEHPLHDHLDDEEDHDFEDDDNDHDDDARPHHRHPQHPHHPRHRHSLHALGPLISPLGVEGLHQIGNSPSILRQYHALGVRYATLTHNCGNRFADAALWEHPFRVAEPVWHGVSPEGRRLIREMNRIGMIVDLAHTSQDTMRDVLGGSVEEKGWEGSAAPVIFSHSSAYAVCPHPRNVPDDVLDLVGKRGGVVMVNFNGGFISCVEAAEGGSGIPEFEPKNSTLAQVVKHVLYIGERIGFDHVGLGSDFDGIQDVPEGLEDVSKFPDLVVELLKHGVRDEDVAKIVGGNVLRVWGEVEAVAKKLQKAGEPAMEDTLSGRLWGNLLDDVEEL
ncbi:membrane dipeptidase-domain-containing protein [Chaetomium sp. MPI-SDFR-AT-0129]|nr:membrane dipeptidase-domain-containing protein [Chaetomium sp. MPI-SDFR-AT-0129]